MDKVTLTIALAALMISLGVPVVDQSKVFNNELKDYYVCDKTENIQEFKGGTSSTGYSGYPFADSRKGAVYCGTSEDKGQWTQIGIYADLLGVDPYDLIPQEAGSMERTNALQYVCTHEGCTRVN